MIATLDKEITIHAIRLSEDNQELVASMCNGSIRGTKLPASKRVVQFYCRKADTEHEIDVGDWLVMFNSHSDTIKQVWTNEQFEHVFQVMDMS